jgi:transferrin binding protein
MHRRDAGAEGIIAAADRARACAAYAGSDPYTIEDPAVKMPLIAAALAACTLAGCGGGGGGGGGGTRSGPMDTPLPDGANRDLTATSTPTAMTVGSVSRMQTSSGSYMPAVTFSNAPTVRISIPALGVDDIFTQADVVSTNVIAGVQIPTARHSSSAGVRTLTWIVPSNGASGLRFSSLGVWDRADLTTGVINQMAAISFGSRTLGSDVPTTGTGSYSGFLIGNAIEANGQQLSISGLASATADFGARSVAFSSTGSGKTDRATGVFTADAGYNVTGTLTYSAGSNTLAGTLNSANGRSGAAAGAFYGPQAAEMGVTFSLTNSTGGAPFVGGAGLKKQ